MKKRFIFFLSMGLVLCLAVALNLLSKEDAVIAQNNPETEHSFAVLNEKAKAARNGDVTAAQEFVGEIISVAGFESELRGFTANAIKDRVGRAESRYRQGLASGIPESKIVRTVNGLVRRFDLPDYVKTSDYEVRNLRLGLLPHFPQVIAQKNQSSLPVSVGEQIDSEMSPAEAVFILAMMIQQKLANPEYQLTHLERVNRWSERRNRHVGGPTQNRSREIETALNQAVLSTSMTDALQLSGITLNTLGIEQ